MKQLLREWDKIGRVKSRVDSEQEVFQVIVLRQEVSGIWKRYHNGIGHPNSKRTLAVLRQGCYWLRMAEDVKQ